jgi:flagellar biosynthetic protein FliQ
VSEALLQTIASQAVLITLKLALPTLLVSMGVGLLVSVIQAVTQIQEQTLSFIPKVLALAGVLVVGGPWMLNQLLTYTQDLWLSIPQLVGA